MIKTSLQYVEAMTLQTQWGHWPTSPTCRCGVWESQEVPGFNAMWFEDDALFCIFVCFFWLCTSFYLETNVDCVWQLIHHDHSPCCRRFKAAQKIQAPVTQGWCMNSKGVQDNYTLLSHFLLKTRLFRLHSLCVTWDGTGETYLAKYTWYDDLKFYHINQTMTLFSSSETFILFAIF